MNKGFNKICLIITGCITLGIGILAIIYLINSTGDKLSYQKAPAIYETVESINENNAVKGTLIYQPNRAIKSACNVDYESMIIQTSKILEVKAEETNELMIQEIEQVEEQVEEQIDEEQVVIEETIDEVVKTAGAVVNPVVVAYTGDSYIDHIISVHSDEISDEDIIFGLSIMDKVDNDTLYAYLEDGLIGEERGQLSDYLHSVLTEIEYAKLKELFYKYNYLLD